MRSTLPSGTVVSINTSQPAPVGGLVIIPDIFGVRPLFDEMVDRFAREWNMRVVAVEPFPGLNLGPEVEPRRAAVTNLDDDKHLADLEAAADMLGVAHVGLMGFCMGGMYCFNSVRSATFAKIASFYGMIRLPEYWRSPSHREPLDYLRAGDAGKVLAIIGTKDPYTPADDVAALRATGAVVREYAQADHGFAHDAARPAHRADDARDAFDAARAWLTPAN